MDYANGEKFAEAIYVEVAAVECEVPEYFSRLEMDLTARNFRRFL